MASPSLRGRLAKVAGRSLSVARGEVHNRFGLLLALLIASFLVSGVDTARWVTVIASLLNLFALIVGLAGTNIDFRRPLVGSLAFIALAGTAMLSTSEGETVGSAFGATAQVVVLSTLTLAVLARVVSDTRVTNQTILGAVAAYFLIGQVFAWLYMALAGYLGEAVLDPPSAGQLPLYYSYIVLTTVGFGDVTPVGAVAQRVTILEALLGQMFLTVLVARLVSVYSSSRIESER